MNLNNILWVYNTGKILPKAPVVENLFGMKLIGEGIITTATGNPVSIVTNKVQNAISTILSYSPKQTGSGDPSPQNIRPIEGLTDANLNVAGKNLICDTFALLGQYLLSDGSAAGSSAWAITDYFPIKGGANYRYYSATVASNPSICFYDKDKTYLTGFTAGYASTNAITAPQNAVYAMASQRRTGDPFILEAGTVKTGYEPYITPTTTTANLGGTYYGFSIDLERGKLLNGWGYIASYDGETLPGRWISDRDVYAPNTTPTTGAEVAYELAEPQTIDITPQTVALLAGNNTLWTDGDSLSVTYRR